MKTNLLVRSNRFSWATNIFFNYAFPLQLSKKAALSYNNVSYTVKENKKNIPVHDSKAVQGRGCHPCGQARGFECRVHIWLSPLEQQGRVEDGSQCFFSLQSAATAPHRSLHPSLKKEIIQTVHFTVSNPGVSTLLSPRATYRKIDEGLGHSLEVYCLISSVLS